MKEIKFKKALDRLNKAMSNKNPEIEVGKLEVGPVTPNEPTPPTETGCPCCGGGDDGSIDCYVCLVRAIQDVETGSQPVVGGVPGCNVCGDGGRSCGPHQIGRDYIIDACDACPSYCAQFGGANAVINKIHLPCPQTPGQSVEDCCRLKVIIGEHLIGCYNKKYGENPNFSCRCKNKDASGKECCSCEEIAKRHQGGYKGPCNDTPRRREYWRRVKERMRKNCPQCINCGNNSGETPVIEVKK